MITVTKGQWFPLTIGNISYAGAAFDLQGASDGRSIDTKNKLNTNGDDNKNQR